MHLKKLKKSTDWFRVTEVRSLEDPNAQVDRKELVISLDQYPVISALVLTPGTGSHFAGL